MPLARLKKKLTKENLWLYILSLLRKESAHAYKIRDMVEKRYGFRIGTVTAYMVLYRLKKKGYVRTRWMVKGRRHRKYYTITKKGEDALGEGIRILENTAKELK